MAGLNQADVDLILAAVDARIAAVEERVATATALALREFQRKVEALIPAVSFGTVIDVDGDLVSVARDVDGVTIQAYALAVLTVGDRVAVHFQPPAAALILGLVGGF